MLKKLSVKLIFLIVTAMFLNINAQKSVAALPENAVIIKLDNGIRVLLIKNAASPMVGINTVVKVGSAYETFVTSGMSHMLEHLLFNGTNKMTQQELYDATDRIGAYNNANTSEYYTNFMMVAPAENIKEAMQIQADMLFRSTLPEAKFNKEKGIVLEEIAKTLANPQNQADRIVNSILFNNHALSLPTLGTYETIKHMKRKDVFNFYKNYYVPNNMTISVIGNFRMGEMIKWLKEIYGKESPGVVKYPNTKGWLTGLEKPEVIPRQELYFGFYKGKLTELFLVYPLPNLQSKAYGLMEQALQKSTFKIKSLIKKHFENIKNISFSIRTTPVKSFLQIKLVLSSVKSILDIKRFVNKNINKLSFEPSESEVRNEAIKAQTEFYKNIEKPHMFGIFNADKFAIGGIESVLSSYLPQTIFRAAKEIKNVKLNNRKPFVILIRPIKGQINKNSNAELEVKLFKNGKGKPIVIVKKVPNDNLLAIHLLFMHKQMLENKFGKDAAWLWHDAFGQRMNSAKVKMQAVNFGFDFTVNDNPFIPMDDIYLDPNFGYIRVEGLSTNIPAAIEFLIKQLKDFVPTKKEFNKAKSNLAFVKMLKRQNRAKKLFSKKLRQVLYDSTTIINVNAKVTYKKLIEFGRQYFNPENVIISVVSRESPDKINRLFNKFSGKVQPLFPDKKALRLKFNKIEKPIKIVLEGGGEQSYLYFGFQKVIKEKEKPALKVLSMLLSNRIIFNVREKKGMAYRMSAGIETLGNRAMFYVRLGTMPQNVSKLIDLFPGLFNVSVADSFTEKELQKTINMYIGRMMFRRLSSINQAYYLAHSFYFDGDINSDGQFLDKLKHVTLQGVKSVAKKYLKIKNRVLIIVK